MTDGPGHALTDCSNCDQGDVLEAGLILTDPTVWASEAWGALAAVPVIPIDTSSTVVAGKKREREGRGIISVWNFLTSQLNNFSKIIKAITPILCFGQVCLG